MDKSRLDEFEYIYKEHYDSLIGYGRIFLKNEAHAFDLLQDTYLKFYEVMLKREIDEPKPYLYRMYRNSMIDFMKKKKPHVELIDDFLGEDCMESLWIEKEEQDLLRSKLLASLKKLTPRQKEIIYLRYFKELSSKEITHIVAMNDQSVRNVLSTAIKNLRVQFNTSTLLKAVKIIGLQ